MCLYLLRFWFLEMFARTFSDKKKQIAKHPVSISAHKFCIIREGTYYVVIRQNVLSILIITISLNMSLESAYRQWLQYLKHVFKQWNQCIPGWNAHTPNRCGSWHTDIAKTDDKDEKKRRIIERTNNQQHIAKSTRSGDIKCLCFLWILICMTTLCVALLCIL